MRIMLALLVHVCSIRFAFTCLSVMDSYCMNIVLVEGILLYSYCIRIVLGMCVDRRGYSYCVDRVNVL